MNITIPVLWLLLSMPAPYAAPSVVATFLNKEECVSISNEMNTESDKYKLAAKTFCYPSKSYRN